MVDRVSHTSSRIPVPLSKSPKLIRNGNYTNDVVVPIISYEGAQLGSNGTENGTNGKECSSDGGENGLKHENGTANAALQSKSPKPIAPKDLVIDKAKEKKYPEKGFETFLMTGEMIIKTNPSLRKADGSGLERHHSDSTTCDKDMEKTTFKRSVSSPDQTTFIGAIVPVDNKSKVSPEDHTDESSINRKASAESGFDEQATHSDSGTLDKKERMPNDPTSVSDLSELESDDMLGNMVDSQTSAISYNVSSVSTPSDLRSDISVNTVLQQEVEPLLHDGSSSSSSSIELSSAGSCSEESPEVIFERSMSDSGGMSPIKNQQDVSKCLISSKSAEKIQFIKQIRQVSQDSQGVRASKSQENYFADDFTFVAIDIDDTAYSLDQIPQPLEKTPTTEKSVYSAAAEMPKWTVPPDHTVDIKDQVQDVNDERIFMPAFIKLEDSVHLEEGDSNVTLEQSCGDQTDSPDDTESNAVDNVLKGAENLSESESNSGEEHDEQMCENETSAELDTCGQEDLFMLPPVKSVDHPSAKRLAKRLYNLDGFRKLDVSRHLSKKNDFSTLVAEEYLKFFTFAGDTLDVALRKFLKQFSLIGETQERERILAHFSRHYLQSNPGSYNSEDACHTLVCAIMLLNTDLHGQAVGRKMTCNEFIENLAELNDGENFPKDILKALYQAIKAEPIEWAPDEEYPGVDQPGSEERRQAPGTGPSLPKLPQVVGRNPFLDVPDPSQTTEYKKGYIMRKCCIDPDGRKTPVGKRGWKMFYVALRDMILYLHKDEQMMKKSSGLDGSHNAIRIHHCLASKATDYSKKQHVFRLQTADWAEYLFQTSNSKELQEWIDTLNFVAATLSAPPLPGAVGSQRKFQRPLLPVSYTRLNLQDQLQNIEERLNTTELELQDHRTYPPEKGSKTSVIQHFLEKENYLVFEVGRLKTYIYLLQSKLASHAELEPSLVETAIGEDEEGFNGVTDNHGNHMAPLPGVKKAGVPRSMTDRAPPNSTGPTVIPVSNHGEFINLETVTTRL